MSTPELLGVLGVERVLGVDEGGDAAPLLGLADDREREGRLARGLRAEDLDHAAAREAADADRRVDRQRAGRDELHRLDLLRAQPHDRALAELPLDLGQGPFDRLQPLRLRVRHESLPSLVFPSVLRRYTTRWPLDSGRLRNHPASPGRDGSDALASDAVATLLARLAAVPGLEARPGEPLAAPLDAPHRRPGRALRWRSAPKRRSRAGRAGGRARRPGPPARAGLERALSRRRSRRGGRPARGRAQAGPDPRHAGLGRRRRGAGAGRAARGQGGSRRARGALRLPVDGRRRGLHERRLLRHRDPRRARLGAGGRARRPPPARSRPPSSSPPTAGRTSS